MRKLLMVGAFLLGQAHAVPLMSSSASVATSSFCAKYKCGLKSTTVLTNPYLKTSDEKMYVYQLPANVELRVIRFAPTMEITDASLVLSGKYGKVERDAYSYTDVVSDFIAAFSGAKMRTTFGKICRTTDALYPNPDYKIGGFIQNSSEFLLIAECRPNQAGVSRYEVRVTTPGN